jgi:hypothetical protein
MGDSIMASIIRATTTSGLQVAPDNSGSLQLQTNGTTTAVTIDTSQNVGIGTASPATTLDVSVPSASTQVSSTTGTNRVFSRVVNSGGNFYFGIDSSTGGLFGNGNYARNIYSDGAYPMVFATNATERMRIDSSGNLLVGATSFSNSGKVSIAQDATVNEPFVINDTSGSASQVHAIAFQKSGTEVGSVKNTNTTTSYITSSDYRLKENVAPMTGALDKVLQLKPVIYKWKVDGTDGQGFIAHELQEVVPDCVIGKKDEVETYTDEDGIEQTRIKPQGIDTSFLVATLTAAIQEMKAIIDAQSVTINDLKARVETLEVK